MLLLFSFGSITQHLTLSHGKLVQHTSVRLKNHWLKKIVLKILLKHLQVLELHYSMTFEITPTNWFASLHLCFLIIRYVCLCVEIAGHTRLDCVFDLCGRGVSVTVKKV